MKIGIDARLLGPKTAGGGLGRYIKELVINLQRIDRENDYFLFLRKSNWHEASETANFHKILADIPWYSFKEQTEMPRLVRETGCELVHYPHFNVPLFDKTPFVVTIHDLILLEHPSTRATTLGPLIYGIKYAAYRQILGHAVSRSQSIIVPSEYVKASILKYFPKTVAQKIKVVYEGMTRLDEASLGLEQDAAFLAERKIREPFILYLGNAYPHKNLEMLIQAFLRLRETKPELQLVLAGQKNFFYERLERETRGRGIKVPEEVNFTGFIDDRDLPRLYRRASLYVFPSLSEGFGLPPLEAASFNLPVASSNASCLPEILGPGAIYFNPRDPDDMARAIAEGLDNKILRRTILNAGKLHMQKYDWQKMAREILEIYSKAL
ncbi:MAG: glycosyltransferase family 1 protein [Patescibacteria group bacterium]|nr:glycosyltransferase family 1 protein [Patescibacteria group bacterium]